MSTTYYRKPKRTDKLSPDDKADLMFDLISSFGMLRSSRDAAYFLEDLLTANEIRNLSVRLRIAKLLLAGTTQREISRRLHTSLGTVNKVSMWLASGGDGFRNIISKLPLRWQKPKSFPKGPIEFHLPALLKFGIETALANSQEKQIKKFASDVKNKSLMDKQIQDLNTELYSGNKTSKNRT